MSKSGLNPANPGILFICISHFLSDLGKDPLITGKQAVEIKHTLKEPRSLADPVRTTGHTKELHLRDACWRQANGEIGGFFYTRMFFASSESKCVRDRFVTIYPHFTCRCFCIDKARISFVEFSFSVHQSPQMRERYIVLLGLCHPPTLQHMTSQLHILWFNCGVIFSTIQKNLLIAFDKAEQETCSFLLYCNSVFSGRKLSLHTSWLPQIKFSFF